jgi:hypothetical protein
LAFSPDGGLLSVQALGKKTADGSTFQAWNALRGEVTLATDGLDKGTNSYARLADGRVLTTRIEGKKVVLKDCAAARNNALGSRRLSADELKTAWADLSDGTKLPLTYEALSRLVEAREQAAPFVLARVKELKPVDVAKIRQSVADLQSENADVVKKAVKQLEQANEAAREELQAAMDKGPPVEARQRLSDLLEKINLWRGEQLRLLRSISVLESSDGPEAREALELLAKGVAGPRLAERATESLNRLREHHPAP